MSITGILLCIPVIHAQDHVLFHGQIGSEEIVPAPKVALKTNMLYDATSTFNLGFEFGLGKKCTFDLSGNYNPWTFSDNRKMKHWLVQPEMRWWTCRRFSGHFSDFMGTMRNTTWAACSRGGFIAVKCSAKSKTAISFLTVMKDGLPERVSVTATIGFSATAGVWKRLSVSGMLTSITTSIRVRNAAGN